MNTHAAQVIDALGGTAEVSRMCGVKPPSVSDWKKEGIPQARMMFLRLTGRKKLAGLDLKAATATRRTPSKEVAHG